MKREYTIELMEFEGVYFPKLYKVNVKAENLSEAIQFALKEVNCATDESEIAEATDIINEDGYNEMFNTKSNIYVAIMFNFILDCVQNSGFRLLKGYCGKRKCFDITTSETINL